ncbi:TetR/AcrR family transcriptional regulator, repressor for divergent bdcA [Albimonas donghaensis]|uniref:TetR/AcrR family transcriptional regulator, repressor for divergent bdcA n=1 Tax=Albimonas donghaensis TaxID=356660 RepID=A0A1H3BJD7_9RHOB|nr:hypothetical protein [Albimonas donghaensis]SDX41851.1 TetR/AcrR family transcriptional regulator, repressor for divergent bdcA [Albimonas donghaensis]
MLGRYSEIGAVPLDRILRPGRPLAEALSEVLVEAARSYTADPDMSGCMVLEGLRSNDEAARAAALARRQAAEAVIHAYIADHRREEAGRLTDYISTCMAGLSAAAVAGHDRGRLLASAKLQGLAIERALGD